MDRLDRMDWLVARLRASSGATMGAMAEELGVSERTVRRDVARLRERGVEIVGDRGRGGGVRLSHRAAPSPVRLDEDEVVALVLSVELARRVPTLPFAASTGSALTRILAALPDRRRGELLALVRRVAVGPPVTPQTAATGESVDATLLARFERAFTARQAVALRYRDRLGESTERRIEPQGLLLRTPLWYVLAFDLDKRAPRAFRMDRIDDLRPLDVRFALRPALVGQMVERLGGHRD